MRPILAALALSALAIAWPAAAAAPKAGGTAAQTNSVEVSALVVPVANADRRLLNYLFLRVTVDAADGTSANALRERTHMLRDSMVRALHRQPITATSASGPYDLARATATLTEAARASGVRARIQRVRIDSAEPLRR
jgi:flagellar basal body-associated protein FliL